MIARMSTGRVSSHRLSAGALEQANRLMAFNWLVAGQAHEDWLGPWSAMLQPRAGVETRVLRCASAALLECHDLNHRWLDQPGEHAWLLLPPEQLTPAVHAIGVAMLGGWVCSGLERQQVAQQIAVLGAEGRMSAMRRAADSCSLSWAGPGIPWPVSRPEPSCIVDLGVSCLAALLADPATGAKQRFLMRFPRDTALPIRLDAAQRGEALALIRKHTTTEGSDR